MTPALAKAFTLCMSVRAFAVGSTAFTGQPAVMVYPAEFPKCAAIVAQVELEQRVQRAAQAAAVAAHARKVYADGLLDLPEGKGK